MPNPLVLDPSGRQRLAEEAVLHQSPGPVVGEIVGEQAWAIGHHELLVQLLSDSRVSKDPRQHWPRFIGGEIVGKWRETRWSTCGSCSPRGWSTLSSW